MKNAFNNNQNDEKDFRKLKIYEIALIKKNCSVYSTRLTV